MLVLGELSTGAADDLAKATDIAREMVTRYGMDAGLGHVAYEPPRSARRSWRCWAARGAHALGGDAAAHRRCGVRAGDEGFAGATRLLTQHRALLSAAPRCCWNADAGQRRSARGLAAPLRSGTLTTDHGAKRRRSRQPALGGRGVLLAQVEARRK